MATPVDAAVVMDDVEDDEQATPKQCPIPGYSDVNEYSQKALRAALMATRNSNNLPVGDDFDFYSTFRSVRDVMDIEGQRILTLLKRMLRSMNVKGNINSGDTAELDDQFDVLMDANDQILERAGTLLDEASGLRKEETKLVIASVSMNKPKAASSWNKKTPKKSSAVSYSLMTARNIQRPQLRFKDKIDNSCLPYRPKLKTKPNAIKSLEESLKLPEGVQPEDLEQPDFNYPNPYLTEIEAFTPTSQSLERVTPVEPKPTTLSPLIMVNTEQQLSEMMADLGKQKEIAVDLEAHTYRSFQGMVCLLQISTRSHDYIVDTLELRSHLHVLNDVFTDPNITKVLHGADMDIPWLQRDFGVYIVNMFDTGQAARVLGLARFSLAHLLMRYCNVEADKQFQLADWRIRPLPAELINYAREDTHFLLYIYDMMRNELLDRGNTTANLLTSVYERSKLVSAKVYQKPGSKPDDHIELYKRSKKAFNSQQMVALRELHAWRDGMARTEDESTGYVLPNHMLLQIAEILPRERQGVLACCNPVPPLVRQSLIEIHAIVLAAREVALVKVEKRRVVHPSSHQHPGYHANSLLNCPHDTSHLDADMELGQTADEGLLAISGSMFSETPKDVTLKSRPAISAYAWVNSKYTNSRSSSRQKAEKITACFANPFTKFMPKELRDNSTIKETDKWIMKASTVKPAAPETTVEIGMKRKAEEAGPSAEADADLTSFEPEYVPPHKRTKVNNATPSTSKSIFAVPSAPQQSKTKTSVDATLTNTVEKKIKTLRDQVNIKKKKNKKELKKKQRMEKKMEEESEGQTPQQKSVNTNNSNTSPTDTPSASDTCVIEEEESGSTPDNTATPSTVAANREMKKAKKKNKKLTMEDVEGKLQGFDYGAAQQAMQKDKKKKNNVDIYNPALPSRLAKDKNKARKPKLSSANSNKLVSFGPSVPGQNKKGKK